MVFCFLVRRFTPRQPVRCGGFFSTIQFSNISSDLRYKNNHKANRSIGQSTLTKRSSYFHIRWLRHFPKVNLYPISGLVGEESIAGALSNGQIAHCEARTKKSPRPVQDASANAHRGRQDAAAGCDARSFGCADLPSWRFRRSAKLDTYLVAANSETPEKLPALRSGKYSEIPNFAHPRTHGDCQNGEIPQSDTHAPKMTRRCVPI